MIQDVDYFGNLDHPYRWHSVSAFRSPRGEPENHIGECRTLMYLITKAIDSQCKQYHDRKGALSEIRRFFTLYVMLSSYIRQAEIEEVRILMDEESRPVSHSFISVPHYEHDPIWCK